MTTLEHKLWIADYEARQEHSYTEDEIYQAAKTWQKRADSGSSRQELMNSGFDPDMFNEYSMVMDFCWDEIDSRYDLTNPLHQAICKFKRQRAQALQEHRDPGAVPEKVQKYFSLAKKRSEPKEAPAQHTAKPKQKVQEAVKPIAASERGDWLLPSIIAGIMFFTWSYLPEFLKSPQAAQNPLIPGYSWVIGLIAGVCDYLLLAVIVLSILGSITEKKGKPLPPYLNIYYRALHFTYNTVRHPFKTIGKVFGNLVKNPLLAVFQIVYVLFCWFSMFWGGILVVALVAFVAAVFGYFTPYKRRRYYDYY